MSEGVNMSECVREKAGSGAYCAVGVIAGGLLSTGVLILRFMRRLAAGVLPPLTIFFVVFPMDSFAIGGISNSKVVVPSTETVPKGRFELEPLFELALVNDEIGTKEFQVGMRFTVGVLDALEAGVSVGANVFSLTVADPEAVEKEGDFDDIDIGLKYAIFRQGEAAPFSLAYQGGVTIPTSGGGTPWVVELAGLILTKDFSRKLSLDADAVIGFVGDDSFTFVAEMGFGYFVAPWLQPVIEAAYSFEDQYGGEVLSVLSLTGGFTMPLAETLTVILGITGDVAEDNADRHLTLTAAFTFLF